MSTTLKTFLTEIADAIREKKGTTDVINAQNFASEIASIEGSEDNSGTIYYKYAYSGGTAVPNDGTQVDKLYFNTSVVNLNEYLKTLDLPFVDYGGMTVYPFLVDLNSGNAYGIVKTMLTNINSPDYVGEFIIIGLNLYDSSAFQILWFDDTWAVENLSFDTPLITVAESDGVPIGGDNDKIKFLISTENNFEKTKVKCSMSDILSHQFVEVQSNDTLNIPSDGFIMNKYLESVNLFIAGNIGQRAFFACPSLTSITLGDGVTSIGDNAFNSCPSLTSVNLGNSVTSIGDRVFYECTSLTSIVIPNSLISIDDDVFYGCSSLTIYCEATSKPSGWNSRWNSSNRPVYWAGQWEYDENGNPIPLV